MLKKEYLAQRRRLILGLVVLILLLLGTDYRSKKQLNYLTEKVGSQRELRKELLKQKEEILFWREKSRKIIDYKKAVNQFDDKIAHDKLLADLISLLNSNLKLSQLSLDNDTIILTGKALTEEAITDSLSRLKASSFYLNFKIINLIKKEDGIIFALEGELNTKNEAENKTI